MNIIAKSIASVTKLCFKRAVEGGSTALANYTSLAGASGNMLAAARKYIENPMLGFQQIRDVSLMRMHKTGPRYKKRKNKNPLVDKPFAKGVVLKTLTKKPKKPNSANRKCVLVRLSTGREMTAYVPGEGHSLQEHNIVLVRPGRCKDVPGVKIKCVRGRYDLPHVIKKAQ